jgi:hypothetical protein
LSARFQDEVNEIVKTKNILDEQFDKIHSLLIEKQQEPNKKIESMSDDELLSLDSLLASFQASIKRIDQIFLEHNKQQSQFLDEKEKAREKLKFSILLENIAKFTELQGCRDRANSALNLWVRLHSKAMDRLNDARKLVRTHGPAVDEINRLLSIYLGEVGTRTDLNPSAKSAKSGHEPILAHRRSWNEPQE